MTINLSVPVTHELKPRLTVVGVGGAGCNAVNNMITAHLEGVHFVVANTDAQALSNSLTERRIQLGTSLTQGLGAGMRPDVGRAAAEEVTDTIFDHLEGAHMLFITAGMGGGTGTGAAPVIARLAREQGILTVGVVTKPFQFEGAKRMRLAEAGIAELQECVDTLIMIPNQNLFRIANENTTFADAFKMADDVLYSGVRGVTDLMVMPGLINLDFQDVRSVMNEMGKAMMGTGEAEGERRALDAAESAINNPLLDDVSLLGARGVLINITGGPDMTLFEVDEACNHIRKQVDDDANIIFGSTFDEELAGFVRVSVVATGIGVDAQVDSQSNTRNGSTHAIPLTVAPVGAVTGNTRQTAGVQPSLGSVSANSPRAESKTVQPARLFEDTETNFTPILHSTSSSIGSTNVDEPVAVAGRETEAQLSSPPQQADTKAAGRAVNDEFATGNTDGMSASSTPSGDSVGQERPDRKGLFSRMARSVARQSPMPVERDRLAAREPVLEAVEVAPAPIGIMEEDRDEDLLEIPAFLRRQAR
tara:strand:+ start:344 stop:1942 length:1599 start_codon:yes stop_codon:yes gene_type:complete